jgi:RHS repeat-associated protein
MATEYKNSANILLWVNLTLIFYGEKQRRYTLWGESLVNITHSSSGSYDEMFKFSGKEKDTESGMSYFGARYFDIDHSGIPISVDRFWMKTPHLSPYTHTGNNPVMQIDINGDSVGIDNTITNDKAINKSFNLFASSKEGIKFLSDYAAKGQTIAGHTYTKNGKYHNKNLHLNYRAEYLEIGERGNTHIEPNASITVTVNSNPIASGQDEINHPKYITAKGAMINPYYVMSKTMTFFHESFIHVDLTMRDFTDDGTRNYSNLPRSLTSWYHDKDNYHHYFFRDGGKTNLFPAAVLQAVKEINIKLGLPYTSSELENMLRNHVGGKRGK